MFGFPALINDLFIGFLEGYYSHTPTTKEVTPILPSIFLGEIARIIAYSAIIIYALSKDKTFDELMIKVRLESTYMIFFGTILFFFGRLLFNIDASIAASSLIEVQIICFLILNAIRKRFLFQ